MILVILSIIPKWLHDCYLNEFPVPTYVCHAILVIENNKSCKTITCGIFNVVDSYCFDVDVKGDRLYWRSFSNAIDQLYWTLHFSPGYPTFSYNVISCHFSTKREIQKYWVSLREAVDKLLRISSRHIHLSFCLCIILCSFDERKYWRSFWDAVDKLFQTIKQPRENPNTSKFHWMTLNYHYRRSNLVDQKKD